MPAPQISPLPTPPSRSQSPETFSVDADAFLGAFPDFQAEANDQADYLDALAVDVTADAAAAEAAAAIATGAANYQGDYSAGTTYQIGESVSYNGRRYVAKTVNTGVTPADGANWFLINDGDVLGPVSATANGIAVYDGTTGKMIKAGPAPSTAGNILVSDGTNWTSAAPAAGGSSIEAIASGSLADGSRVIVNADGTVSVVQASTAPSSPLLAGTATFLSVAADYANCAYHENAGKVVVAYRLQSNGRAFAIVGTIVGNNISFGSPVQFSPNSTIVDINIVYHTAQQKIVVCYRDTGNGRFYARVGTVSGSSISFGSDTQIGGSTGGSVLSAVYHAAQQKIAVFYTDAASSFYGTGIVGTVSGTSITFGASQAFVASSVGNFSSTYDANAQRVVIAYKDFNDARGKINVGTISGTSITFGSVTTFNAAETGAIKVAYAANAQKIVIAYQDKGNADYGHTIVGTISGTSISFGSEIVFRSSATDLHEIHYDDAAQKVVIFFDGGAISGLVSGTSITFGTSTAVASGYVSGKCAYNPVIKKIIAPITLAASGKLDLISSVGSNMTAGNFIGFSDGAYSNGQTATIQVVGSVNTAQSGLTAGSSYYVQYDGTLDTVEGTPSVFAGIATAANKIIVKG